MICDLIAKALPESDIINSIVKHTHTHIQINKIYILATIRIDSTYFIDRKKQQMYISIYLQLVFTGGFLRTSPAEELIEKCFHVGIWAKFFNLKSRRKSFNITFIKIVLDSSILIIPQLELPYPMSSRFLWCMKNCQVSLAIECNIFSLLHLESSV